MQKAKKIITLLALCGAITASATVERPFVLPEIKQTASIKLSDKIDSLNYILSQAVDDTNKVNILNALSECYIASAPEKALETSKSALALSEKIDWTRGKALSLNSLSIAEAKSNNKETNKLAVENCKKSIKIFDKLNDSTGVCNANINIGLIYRQIYDNQAALASISSAIDYAEKLNNNLLKAKANYELGCVYWALGNYDSAEEVLNKSLSLTRKLKNKFLESKTLGTLGLIYRAKSDYKNSLKAVQESIIIKAELGDKAGIAHQMGGLASTYFMLAKYDEAQKYYENSVALKLELHDTVGAASLYGNLGTLFIKKADYSKALQYMMKGLDILEKTNEKLDKGNTLAMIGNVYIKLKDPTKALEYYNKAIAVFTEIGREQAIGDQYGNIATVYFAQNDNDKAIEYSQKSCVIQEKYGRKADLATDYSNIARCYQNKKNFEKSFFYYHKALKIRQEIEDAAAAIDLEASIALLQYQEATDKNLVISDSLRNAKINNAIDYFKRAEAKYSETGEKAPLKDILFQLSDAYSVVGNYKNALETYKQATILNDSIFSLESKKEIANLEATKVKVLLEQDNRIKELEIAKKNQQVSLLENQQNLQELDLEKKDIQLEILNKNKNIQELELKKNRSEAENSENEIKLLQYQKEYVKAVSNSWTVAFIFSAGLSLIVLFFYRRKRKDNKILVLQNQLISEQKEELTKLVSVVQDREELLFEANATKDKFFSIIAHDLKNPVQTVILSSELLNRNYEKYSPEQFRERLNKLSRTTMGISTLLDTLLAWSRTQNGRLDFKPENAIIKKVVIEEFNLMGETAERKQIALVDNTSFEMRVYADVNMLTTMLRNMISNAIKFTKNGGEISVSLDNKEIDGRISSVISVSDTGIGMSEQTLGNLFKLDSVGKTLGTAGETGTGLGLILCKEFAERHNGKIHVESEINKGSVFQIILPLEHTLQAM